LERSFRSLMNGKRAASLPMRDWCLQAKLRRR
jgi:hypothetical protein